MTYILLFVTFAISHCHTAYLILWLITYQIVWLFGPCPMVLAKPRQCLHLFSVSRRFVLQTVLNSVVDDSYSASPLLCCFVQGASAGHQLSFVDLKLWISVSNSGGSATYINNGMLWHILHVHHVPELDQVDHEAGKQGGRKVLCFIFCLPTTSVYSN